MKKLGVVCLSALLGIGVSRAQSSAYFNAITNLNPAGYWPMHEVETAAAGDTEHNYGTLGLLGTGYYPDWVANYGGLVRQVPGALSGDSTQPSA